MPSYVPAKKNTQLIFYAGLVSQADTKLLKSSPTIASGDFKTSLDGGSLGNLGTLPTVTPSSSVMVKFTLSTGEMNGDNATVVCSDAAGAEWCDQLINVQTAARQIEDLAYPATSGRSLAVDANGVVDANLALWRGTQPNTLTSGRVEVLLGAVTNGVIAAASFAANALDAVWSTAVRVLTANTNLNDLSASGVRAAVGLASANLDTQLAAIVGYIDTEVAAILAAVDTEVAAIKAKTDNLPASPAATGDAMALTAAAVDAILDDASDGSVTVRQLLRGFAAALLGKASGLNTTTAVFRDVNDTKNRITATVDADGNRTAITLDLT